MSEKKSFFSFRHKKETSEKQLAAPYGAVSPTPDQYGQDTPEFQEQDHSMLAVFGPFIKNLTSSKSPGKLPYPPQFYYPASSLQHQTTLQMNYIDLLLSANVQTTPLDRFLFVVKYALSTASLTKFPYKPFIAFPGETSHVYTVHGEEEATTNDMTFFVGEQLMRDPPASAFHIENSARGVVHEGSMEMQPKFKQAHVQAKFVGQHKCTLTDPHGRWKEEYLLNVPDLMIRLVRMFTELAGDVVVSCPTTGYTATITYKEKPLIGGGKNLISGKISDGRSVIYTLDGGWDDVVYLHQVGANQTFEFFNRKTYRKQRLYAPPLAELPETSGDRVWGGFIDALKRQDFPGAMAIKDQIQIVHTEQDRLHAITPFVPNYFAQSSAGTWALKDPSLVTIATPL